MRFRVEPRDVPSEHAARRMGLSHGEFLDALPDLIARGFPRADATTQMFDLDAIDAWRRSRHPHLFGATMGAHGKSVVKDRLAALKGGAHG
jgi:hypothetical protein